MVYLSSKWIINGDEQWYPIDLIKDEDPHAPENYIITNNLGTICNMNYLL